MTREHSKLKTIPVSDEAERNEKDDADMESTDDDVSLVDEDRQFTDSLYRLHTLLFHVVVVERHGLTQETKAILTYRAGGELTAGTEMWDAAKTVRELRAAGYYTHESTDRQDFEAWTLAMLTRYIGTFPDLKEKLAFVDNAFDKAVALKTGTIQPQPGMDPEYDDAVVAGIESDQDEYLETQGAEMQEHRPAEYELKSKKKEFKRFHTPFLRHCLQRLPAAEVRREVALKDSARRTFANFDKWYTEWKRAVQHLAVWDCLMSLSRVSGQSEGYTRPEFVQHVRAHYGGAASQPRDDRDRLYPER
ncbi:hypothetical protein DYB32_008069 [Aphanomyces invadans]|uniref:Uncharacterized protein n=1 Tax=Aphanomyces invadans TaxID=157072 RepID=A0A418AMC9_9STRA|nr:hypothetical protein DYB32_008069 [Aphanomyces invadans]